MKTKKLRTKILTFVLPLTLVPFVLTALAVYYVVIRAYTTQIEEEQNKLLAEAIVNMRREQEATRKDVAVIAQLPTVVEYLELASGEAQSSTDGARVTSSFHAKEAAARATVQLFLSQNSYYLQLSLVDAQGRERLKFSKLPGASSLGSIKGEDVFRRTLISGQVQMPVKAIPAEHFASTFTSLVRRETFAGAVILDLNTAVFQRSLRPLLISHGLATFVFDDRGVVFAKSLAGQEDEDRLAHLNLKAEAAAVLAQPALEVSPQEIASGAGRYLFSVLPAEEFISFIEPLSGENWFLGVLRPKDVLAAPLRAFQMIFFGVLILAVAAVLWVTARTSRRMTVPLEQVTRATADIARGQFDLTLGIATGDEVEELAVAVQRMAEDLKTYQAELIKSAKLATIGEMASEISHEIQNRISGLSLWLQYLDAEVEADDPKREYLKEMKQGLQGFMELLAALKQFYRTPILQLSEVNLNELVRESLPYIQERIEARKINVELQLDSSLPLVTCDAEKITSVILNLLVNAVDAVADGGRIRIHTGSQNHPDGQTAILSVTDNGQGIAEEDLPRIFYPFYSTKAGGSGLGLAIASNLILAHGGKIEVKSRVGEGTTFTVILPQASALADRTVVGTQFSDLEDRVVDL